MKVRTPVRRERAGVAMGLVGTTLVHGALAGALLAAAASMASPKSLPPAYAVELVAAPRPDPQIRRAPPEALPTPPEEKPAPIKPPPKVKPVPKPPEPRTPPRPEPETREPPAKTRAPVEPLPGETPSTGTDVANVKTPGLAFPYPEYLRNIVSQIYRRWDRGGRQSRRAEFTFLILRDGTVREIKTFRSSGNFAFDLEAQGAIEAAANAQAFGPLPEGYPSDVLPITFYFAPRSQ
ncbi:MAG: TonB C-terminal domain-containing protein [Gemmatimonadales bacterium]